MKIKLYESLRHAYRVLADGRELPIHWDEAQKLLATGQAVLA